MQTATKQDDTFKATLIRPPLKAKSDDWQETAYKWSIMLYGQEFDYYTGIGNTKPIMEHARERGYTYKELRHKNLTDDGIKTFIKLAKPIPPEADAVIHSLIMDASASEQSFDSWCGDYGYDSDSIKALDTYRDCQRNSDKLRKTGLNIEKERERLQDY